MKVLFDVLDKDNDSKTLEIPKEEIQNSLQKLKEDYKLQDISLKEHKFFKSINKVCFEFWSSVKNKTISLQELQD